MKKQGSCPDFVTTLLNSNDESDNVIKDILDTKFEPNIVASADDFVEIERLMSLDDIEFETQEEFLMEQIYDFIDRTELSA